MTTGERNQQRAKEKESENDWEREREVIFSTVVNMLSLQYLLDIYNVWTGAQSKKVFNASIYYIQNWFILRERK